MPDNDARHDLQEPTNRDSPPMRRSVVAVFVAGLALICAAVVAVAAHSPLAIAGRGLVPRGEQYLEFEGGKLSTCQAAGVIPQGTSAVRIGIEGRSLSPAVRVTIRTAAHTLAEGWHAPGLGPDPNVTVHVKRFARTVGDASICTTVTPLAEPIRFYGKPKRSIQAKQAKEGLELRDAALSIEYLRPGPKSWWSLLPSIVDRMGFGHVPRGAWAVLIAIALMLALVALTLRLALRELR